MVSFKDQLISEASLLAPALSREELSEKISNLIENQILPEALIQMRLPRLPSPASVKTEELMAARYGKRAYSPLHDKMRLIQDLEKIRYKLNGSDLTDVNLPIGSEKTMQTTIGISHPEPELDIERVGEQLSVDMELIQDISPAPFGEPKEKIKSPRLIEFDSEVTQRIVSSRSFATLIGAIESKIRSNYSHGKISFSFSIRADLDIPSREKTKIYISLPDYSFEEKMDFWDKIETEIKNVIESLDVSEDERNEIRRNLLTHVRAV